MAVLRDIDNKLAVVFKLEGKKQDWLIYSLSLNELSTNKELIRLNEQSPLYLDNRYDPEIPQLLDGLNKVMNGQEKACLFEPVDEKDFSLKATCLEQKILIDLWFNYPKISGCHLETPVGTQFYCKAEQIKDFIKQVESEFTGIS